MMYKHMKEVQQQQVRDQDRVRIAEIIEKERILDQIDQEKKDKHK